MKPKCYRCGRKITKEEDKRSLYGETVCKECYQSEMEAIEDEAYGIWVKPPFYKE